MNDQIDIFCELRKRAGPGFEPKIQLAQKNAPGLVEKNAQKKQNWCAQELGNNARIWFRRKKGTEVNLYAEKNRKWRKNAQNKGLRRNDFRKKKR